MFRSTILAATVALGAATTPALASTVVLDVPGITMNFASHEGVADLFADAPAFAVFQHLAGDYAFDMALTYTLADPFSDMAGFFSLSFAGEETLFAELTGAAYDAGADMLSFAFAPVSGGMSAVFGPAIDLQMVFFDFFGTNPLLSFQDGGSYEAMAMAATAPVPLPAGIVLLGSGVLALMALRRRRTA